MRIRTSSIPFKEIDALREFTEQFFQTRQPYLEDVATNIVEIKKNGRHTSNGLLITTNGYFITTYHCLEDPNRTIWINNQEHELERICSQDKGNDIVFAKVRKRGKCIPLEYNFLKIRSLVDKDILVLTRRDGVLDMQPGFVAQSFFQYSVRHYSGIIGFNYHLEINSFIIPGDSGGTVITPQGDLVAIMSTGSESARKGSAAKLISFLGLIQGYANSCIR